MANDYAIRSKVDDLRGYAFDQIAEMVIELEEQVASLRDESDGLRGDLAAALAEVEAAA